MKLKSLIDIIKVYIWYVIFHKFNKRPSTHFEWLEEHWEEKPSKGIELLLWNKLKKLNNYETEIFD
jgi:hypothetical protein